MRMSPTLIPAPSPARAFRGSGTRSANTPKNTDWIRSKRFSKWSTVIRSTRLAALGGFPVRYPHWRFGMEYDQLQKGYEWGLQKIYEMVINTDPAYAYLMKSNSLVDQKTVMAHVYGHVDFFKNNYWFSKTNRKMLDTMANHAVKIRNYMDRYGQDTVEQFIDFCLSIENLIDPHLPFATPKRRPNG